MAFSELFGTFEVKNTELAALAQFAHECAVTTAKEQSGGSTMGLNEHAMRRQRQYIENIRARIKSILGRPIPDLPVVHPMNFTVEWSEPELISVDGKPLNSDAKAVAQTWQIIAYELIKSNSAGMGGGLTSFDGERANNNVGAVEQFLAAIEQAADVDFPETAAPEAQPASAQSRTRR